MLYLLNCSYYCYLLILGVEGYHNSGLRPGVASRVMDPYSLSRHEAAPFCWRRSNDAISTTTNPIARKNSRFSRFALRLGGKRKPNFLPNLQATQGQPK
ncbi:hypothetical protein Fmac_016107 [Flemingia macrophylla]|uniref:Secreted protein n=1 Tax=Flemingia macrophylla TaxID=520843 RepID=A0ABD1MGL6_9FABA